MERRNLIAGLAALIVGLLMLGGTASAHATHHKKAKPKEPTPSAVETCAVYTEPGSFMDQGEFDTSSGIADIISVECEPVYAEKYVRLSAAELYSRCNKQLRWSEAAPWNFSESEPSFTVKLDNDGNGGAVVLGGPSCASGESLVSAHLESAPFTTVTTSFTVLPPRPTTPGVKVEPPTGVESEENSSVPVIIQVEFPPVFAEEPVNINAAQLQARCHEGEVWDWFTTGPAGPEMVPITEIAEARGEATVTLDNDGNAFVVLLGAESCAAGSSLIEASLENAPYTTYTSEFTIEPPRPTFP
jgi:hypothetical protein